MATARGLPHRRRREGAGRPPDPVWAAACAAVVAARGQHRWWLGALPSALPPVGCPCAPGSHVAGPQSSSLRARVPGAQPHVHAVPLSCRGLVSRGRACGGLCFVSGSSRVPCPVLGVRVGTCQGDCPLRLTCPGPSNAPCFRMPCPRKDPPLTACLGGGGSWEACDGPTWWSGSCHDGGTEIGPLRVAGRCGMKGSQRRGSIPWVSQDRRGDPGGPRGWDRLWVPGRAWGQRRPSWHLPHAKVCAPPRSPGHRGQGVGGGDANAARPTAE